MIREITINDNSIDQLESLVKSSFSYDIKEDLTNNFFSKYFIYEENNNIIGFINYSDLYDRFELNYIYVKEEFRNKKIASKLMTYFINIGTNKNIDNITLEVSVDNKIAICLYEKYNFKQVAIRKNYYNGVDGILMERMMKDE
jgi:ribosomal-protein-alanine N-acetyltransferase